MPQARRARNRTSQAAGKPTRDPAAVLAASTFSAGLLLLPTHLQTDARQLYNLLRTLDDLVDEGHPDATQRVHALEQWDTEQPDRTPETATLAALTERYPIPRQAVLDFCAGMRHDLTRNTIDTEDDLENYCHQVGGTVGIMLTALLGSQDPDCAQGMDALGRAMQRTNILRDIDEDHANGRTYIAQSSIARYGPPLPGTREALLRDQIPRADSLYEQAAHAIETLQHGRDAMRVSTALYREILRQIERDGFGRKPGRATIPTWRKQILITKHLKTPPRKPTKTTAHSGAPPPDC